jgi:aminopeptidase-like protein
MHFVSEWERQSTFFAAASYYKSIRTLYSTTTPHTYTYTEQNEEPPLGGVGVYIKSGRRRRERSTRSVRFSFVLALAISPRALVDIFYIRPIEFEIHQCLEQLAEPIARTFDPFLESC